MAELNEDARATALKRLQLASARRRGELNFNREGIIIFQQFDRRNATRWKWLATQRSRIFQRRQLYLLNHGRERFPSAGDEEPMCNKQMLGSSSS